MMDALTPAVDAVSAAAGAGKTIEEALDDAAHAAKVGSRVNQRTWLPVMAGPGLWESGRGATRMQERLRWRSSSKDSGRD